MNSITLNYQIIRKTSLRVIWTIILGGFSLTMVVPFLWMLSASFKIPALVGPSGSGKTTIINLLMRFYDVYEGLITLDGVDIKSLKIGNYRKFISLVLQDSYLFDGTIRQNIAFGKPDSSLDEIVQSSKIAYCHDFIMMFEINYAN